MAAFGRYELVAILGQGGFATVHRAHDPVLDRDVAIKVLHGYLAGDEQVAERFVREGRALARIKHPNLVQVYDAGTIDGQTFLAMEFVDGKSLADIAAGRQMPLGEAARIAGQIAGAIDAVHATGLIHRDIKPANIIVEASGRAVLLDLGIARDMATTGLTASGMVVGTPGFLAPEQVDSSVFVGPRTDVYQLAATAYTLLAGKPPYEGDTAQVLYSVAHKPPPDLGEWRPDLPYQTIAAVTQALAKDPSQRPESASVFAAALAGAEPPIAAVVASASAEETVVARGAAKRAQDSSAETVVAAGGGARTGAVSGRPQPPAESGSRTKILVGLAAAVVAVVGVALAFSVFSDGGGTTEAGEDPDATNTAAAAEFGDIRTDGKEVEFDILDGAPTALSFRGPASGTVSFVVRDASAGATYRVKDGRDKPVDSGKYIAEGGGFVEPIVLPEPGDYVLEVTGSGGAGRGSIVMYEVPQPGSKTVAFGSDVELVVEVPGATDRATFEAAAGQRISVEVTEATHGFYLYLAPAAKEESEIDVVYVAPEKGFLDVVELAEAGSYVLIGDPAGSDTLRATLTLHDPGDDVSRALTLGVPQDFRTSTPGENVHFTFSGKRDQQISIRASEFDTGSYVYLRRADDDEEIESTWTPEEPGSLTVVTLPEDGPYVITVDPDREKTEAGTIGVYDITERVAAAASVGGGSATLRATAPGQQARITFTGTAGQLISLRSKSSQGVYATVTTPGGVTVIERQWVPAEFLLKDVVLAEAGEYTILLEPSAHTPATYTIELLSQ